jgi:hypothetical protein
MNIEAPDRSTLRRHHPPVCDGFLPILAACVLLISAAAGICQQAGEQEYLAKVTMEPRVGQGAPGHDPQFIATTIRTLREAAILQPVIKELYLVKHYSKAGPQLSMEQVLRRLNKKLVVKEVRNTGLVELGVYDSDPQEAAKIANAIFLSYRNHRLKELQMEIEMGLAQFTDEVEKQRQVVNEAAAERARIAEEADITDFGPDDGNAKISPPAGKPPAKGSTQEQMMQRYTTAKAKYLQAKEILKAAELRLSTERMEKGIDFEPVKLWERAEPPSKPTRFNL